jgi:enoyl-CoA hydratase/carnithine racemase
MGEEGTILYERRPGAAWLSINRPEARNAINVAVMRDLLAGLARAKSDGEVRVVVLTGVGEKAFCAGGDLGGFAGGESRVEQHLMRGELVELIRAMQAAGKPIVARVNGHALAGGFGLMLACDLVVASSKATFGMTEVNVGLWPFIISAVVARNLPQKVALELMLTGKRVSAEELARWGVLSRVVPPEELDAATQSLVDELASKSPLIVKLGKDSFYAGRDMGMEEALRYLHGQLAVCLESEDTQEGVMAFIEKRAPVWKGR